ncbi:Alpha N-terminal protein methyltransferase 1 [Capsicum baccatum]|uniref:Alpha N-terminal protein methyltransferase 1 n=1 Tax=Capsicum baccatum TaxID=33114 RepID=A0A2G2XBC5_CAPBA|nr:Alpha N-terminal protein methyltransferase 1 [Capsicum baccatum]
MMYLFYIGTAKALVFSCFCNIGFKFLAPKSATRRAFPGRRQTQMEMGGLDSDGRKFKNAEEMWREEVGDGDSQKKSQWYNKGIKYWQGVEATMDGVLGGYGHVNAADIKASEDFLNTILAERFPDAGRGRRLVALDCGSGIGRVTKNLLIRYFNEVDLLEPVLHFLESARVNLAPENLMVSESHKAANFYCVPLQVLDETISTSQSAFVEGRQFLDAALVANKVMDSRRKQGVSGVLCKLDIEKAYGHVNWKFLDFIML